MNNEALRNKCNFESVSYMYMRRAVYRHFREQKAQKRSSECGTDISFNEIDAYIGQSISGMENLSSLEYDETDLFLYWSCFARCRHRQVYNPYRWILYNIHRTMMSRRNYNRYSPSILMEWYFRQLGLATGLSALPGVRPPFSAHLSAAKTSSDA